MKNPCWDCPDRKCGCHADCERYTQWSSERRAAIEKDHDAREARRYEHDRGIRLSIFRVRRRARGRKG